MSVWACSECLGNELSCKMEETEVREGKRTWKYAFLPSQCWLSKHSKTHQTSAKNRIVLIKENKEKFWSCLYRLTSNASAYVTDTVSFTYLNMLNQGFFHFLFYPFPFFLLDLSNSTPKFHLKIRKEIIKKKTTDFPLNSILKTSLPLLAKSLKRYYGPDLKCPSETSYVWKTTGSQGATLLSGFIHWWALSHDWIC